jgi:hypothetical protein
MNFEKLISSWSYSTARRIEKAIQLYGPFNFALAKRELDIIALHVIEEQGGWEKVCDLKAAEPPSLNEVWAGRARVCLIRSTDQREIKEFEVHSRI